MTEYVTYSLPGVVDSLRDGITIEPYDALGSNFLPAIDLAFSNWELAIDAKFFEVPATEDPFPFGNEATTCIFAGKLDGPGGLIAKVDRLSKDIVFDIDELPRWGGLDAMSSVFAHELGHVLGHRGHTERPDDLMYHSIDTADTPKFLSFIELDEWQSDFGAALSLGEKASGAEGQLDGLYNAAFDRDPDTLGFLQWEDEISEGGSTVYDIAEDFVASQEFHDLYGDASKSEFVTMVYDNTFDREATSAEVTAWTNLMDEGLSEGAVLVGFALSAEHRQHILDDGLWYMSPT